MLDLVEFEQASKRVSQVSEPTPLQYSGTFSRMSGHQVWLKPENLQKTGAFKIRGAYNRLSQLSCSEADKGVITASSGNHGAAVAHAATRLGIESTVVMPEDAPQSKKNAVRGYGAEVQLHGRYADERKEFARRLAVKEGLTYIDSTDDEGIIAGQGTLALEIIDELDEVDVIVGPIGGGGLMSGVSRAAKLKAPDVQVIGVEPDNSACMYASVEAGVPVEVEVDTVADGLRTKKPGSVPVEYISSSVDRFHQVSDALIIDSVILALQRTKLLLEPSAAVSLAGVLDNAVPGKNRNVAVILTGGNVDLEVMADFIERGLCCLTP